MNQIIINTLQKRIALFVFLALYILVSVATYTHYGITNDEAEEYTLGKILYIKLVANDPVLEKSFLIDDGNSPNLLRYNHIYQAIFFALNTSESFETYHLLNLLFTTTILVCSFELLLPYTKKNWHALAGPVLLLLLPRFSGHIAGNPKDVPFAIAYFVSLYLITLTQKNKHPLLLFVLGLSFGMTQSLRFIGYSIYIVFAIALFLEKSKGKWLQWLTTATGTMAVVAAIGLLVQMVTLPYFGGDPLQAFRYQVESSLVFPWTGDVLFGGKLYTVETLSWYYLPVWLLITTPVLFLLLLGFSTITYQKHSFSERLLWIALFVNLAIFFVLQPHIYDGLRHMLFILPMIAGITGFALVRAYSERKKILLMISLLSAVVTVLTIVHLFPYQYTYFNELIGGNAGAAKQFEQEYWGASYKESVEWLAAHTDASQEHFVYTCGDPAQFAWYAPEYLTLTTDPDQAEFLICHHRAGNTLIFERFTERLYAVERAGVTFAEVKQK